MIIFCRFVTVGSAFLILLLPQVALTSPRPITSQFPIVPDSEVGALICYMQTEDGQTLNLDRLCKQTNRNSANLQRENVEMSEGNSVGNQPCYAIDSNGRPCPATDSQG